MSVKPISPDEIASAKASQLPEAVLSVFNELIAKKWNGSRAVVEQDTAVVLIASRLEIDRNKVFEDDFLEIEDIYRDAGWSVEYDKPGYNEDYSAKFIFTKKSTRQ